MFRKSSRSKHLNIHIIILIGYLIFLKPMNTISQNPPPSVSVSPFVIGIQQPDGTTIRIIGKVERYIPYTETEDGYTLLKNDQNIYEYAKRASNGRLQLSGLKAKDATKRSKKDKKRLSGVTKHLRYEPPFLDTLLRNDKKLKTN